MWGKKHSKTPPTPPLQNLLHARTAMALAPPILPPQQHASLFLAARGQSRLLQAHLLCVFAAQTQNRRAGPAALLWLQCENFHTLTRATPLSGGVSFLQPGRLRGGETIKGHREQRGDHCSRLKSRPCHLSASDKSEPKSQR